MCGEGSTFIKSSVGIAIVLASLVFVVYETTSVSVVVNSDNITSFVDETVIPGREHPKDLVDPFRNFRNWTIGYVLHLPHSLKYDTMLVVHTSSQIKSCLGPKPVKTGSNISSTTSRQLFFMGDSRVRQVFKAFSRKLKADLKPETYYKQVRVCQM